jgi:urea carboxylase/allophanate hydrolase
MVAKIIASGKDRATAIRKISLALEKPTVIGVEMNLRYLPQTMTWNAFTTGELTTNTFNRFPSQAEGVETIEAGSDTHIHVVPERQGLCHIGEPPSRPMDSYSFRLANKIVGNEDGALVFEYSIQGHTPLFHCQATVAVVGANSPVFVDGA